MSPLENLHESFLEDLNDSFGEKATHFSEDLRATLFDLWARARLRPEIHESDGRRRDKLAHHLASLLGDIVVPGTQDPVETDLVDSLACLREAFKEAVLSLGTGLGAKTISVDGALEMHVGADGGIVLSTPSGTITDEEFARRLNQSLEVDGVNIQKRYDPIMDKVELTSPSQPARNAPIMDSFDTEWLEEALESLNIRPLPQGWLPVAMARDGRKAAVDLEGRTSHVVTSVRTYLTYDPNTLKWRFPNPMPAFTGDECPHVLLFVDGVEQVNHDFVWDTTHRNGRERVQNVYISIAHEDSVVEARYETTVVEHLS